MAVNTQTVTASSIGSDAGNSFSIYWDSPNCDSLVNVHTGSDGSPLSIGSGSLTTGVDVDFPVDATFAYIKINSEVSGSSEYCMQCFGPVAIPGASTPIPATPSSTPTPTPTTTPTSTPFPTATPNPTVVARSIRLHESTTANNTTEVCAETPSYTRYFIPVSATIESGLRIYTDGSLTNFFYPNPSTTFAQIDDVDNSTLYGVDFAGNGTLGSNVDECTI